ncbi:MAG: PRC-barrel domain-containing protein [Sphingomonadales bacterium]|nr:PRC-barrel domain-containing protein [Sphingomonadales bacterium]
MKRFLIPTVLGLTLAMPVMAQDLEVTPMPEGTIGTQGEGAMNSDPMTQNSAAPQVTLDTDTRAAWDAMTADELHGKTIWGPNGETVGDVSDVVLNDQMQITGVIVDVGGFLGMGEKSVAIDPEQIALMQDGEDITLHIAATEAELKAMPEYQG